MDKDGDGTIDQTEAKKAFRAFNVDKVAYETRRSALKTRLDEKREAGKAERQTLDQMEVAGVAAKAAKVKQAKQRSGKPKTKGGKGKAKQTRFEDLDQDGGGDSKREATELVMAEVAAETQDTKSVAFSLSGEPIVIEPQAAIEPQLMEC